MADICIVCSDALRHLSLLCVILLVTSVAACDDGAETDVAHLGLAAVDGTVDSGDDEPTGEAEVEPSEQEETLEDCVCEAIGAYEGGDMGPAEAKALAEAIQACLDESGVAKLEDTLTCDDKTYVITARTHSSNTSSASGTADGVIAVGGDAAGSGAGGPAKALNKKEGGWAVAVGGDGGDPEINSRKGGAGGHATAATSKPKGSAHGSGGAGGKGVHGNGACAVADQDGASSAHGGSQPNQ